MAAWAQNVQNNYQRSLKNNAFLNNMEHLLMYMANADKNK